MTLQYAINAPTEIFVREQTERDHLDEVLDEMLSGNIASGMSRLISRLHDLYTMTSSKEWKSYVTTELFKHRVKDLILQDPLTARSLSRPRGYAGDAELLDMIYFPERINAFNTTLMGRKIFRYTSHANISRDLRNRKQIVADFIDSLDDSQHMQVLSVACGHGREIELSQLIQNNKLKRFVCLDQDMESLSELNRNYSKFGVDTVAASVADIINGRADLGKFDLIYSAGLYDYLSNRLANKLTTFLYRSLLPGGRLVLFNAVQNFKEIGYFESFMNWSLIGRDDSQLLAFADDLPSRDIASINIENKSGRSFNYIEITKS